MRNSFTNSVTGISDVTFLNLFLGCSVHTLLQTNENPPMKKKTQKLLDVWWKFIYHMPAPNSWQSLCNLLKSIWYRYTHIHYYLNTLYSFVWKWDRPKTIVSSSIFRMFPIQIAICPMKITICSICFRMFPISSGIYQANPPKKNKLCWYPQPQRFIFTNLSEACWEAKRWKHSLSWVSVS